MIERQEAWNQARKIVKDNPAIDEIYHSFHDFPRDDDDEETKRRKLVSSDDYSEVIRGVLLGYVKSDSGQQRLDRTYSDDELNTIVDNIDDARMSVIFEKTMERFPLKKTAPPDDGTIKGNL